MGKILDWHKRMLEDEKPIIEAYDYEDDFGNKASELKILGSTFRSISIKGDRPIHLSEMMNTGRLKQDELRRIQGKSQKLLTTTGERH